MNFQKWLSVNLEHGYFADHRCPSLGIEPTSDCREQMRRRGQFFYPLPNGFFIFQDTDKIRVNQNGTAESCFFDIAVSSPDELLGNYSNLELDYRRGRAYYVGNSLKSEPDKNKEKQLTLTDREGGKETEAVPVLLEPKQFSVSLDEAAPGDTFKLLDKHDSVVVEKQVKDKTGPAALYADVSKKSAGIYRLEKNNTVTAWFYADDMLYHNHTKPAFIIGIEAAPPGNTGGKKTAIQTYDIRVANRAVFWQYHVIARTNSRKLKNLEIRNNNEKSLSGVSFEQVNIDEEGKEVIFVSSRPVPVSEKAYQAIELIEKGSSTPLVPHLPNAGISTLHVKEGKWVSRMYIYI
jgi:hypothetical protein